MATLVYLNNPTNNLVAKAYVGFSWTSLFLGPWPLLFRNEWGFFLVFIAVYIVVGAFTLGIGSLILGLVWAFIFNKWHMKRLIEPGYAIDVTKNRAPADEAQAQGGIG